MEIRKSASSSPIRSIGGEAAKAGKAEARKASDGLSSFEPDNTQAKKKASSSEPKLSKEEQKLSDQLDEMIMQGFIDEMKKSSDRLTESMKDNG